MIFSSLLLVVFMVEVYLLLALAIVVVMVWKKVVVIGFAIDKCVAVCLLISCSDSADVVEFIMFDIVDVEDLILIIIDAVALGLLI